MADPTIPAMVLKPYVVTLSFADGGPLFLNAVLAPSAEAATALFAIMTMQQHNLQQPLMGCAAMELTPEFLQASLRAVEGKLPPNGEAQVLSLVPGGLRPAEPDVQAAPSQDDPPPAAA